MTACEGDEVMKPTWMLTVLALTCAAGLLFEAASGQDRPNIRAKATLNVKPASIATDSSVKYDFDIIYVRAPRKGDGKQIAWTEVFNPLRAEPGSDLMLL